MCIFIWLKTKIALDVTCIRFPSPLLPKEDVHTKLFLETKNSFAPYLYKNLQDADKRKRNHKYDGGTVSSLLAVHNTAFIPIALDPLGGLGPSASMLIYGRAYPNFQPSVIKGEKRVNLYSDSEL